MSTRKSFSNKKELIKYLLDADSNAQEYVLQIPTKKPTPQIKQTTSTQLAGLWYGYIVKQIRQINTPITALKIDIEANWWFTQIDSDSRHEVGEQAEVDKKWYEVAQLAEAISDSQYLATLEELKLVIIHPLLEKHFDELVEALNALPKLAKIQIDFPQDTGTYFIEKGNWTQKLRIKPILKFTSNYWPSPPYDYDE